MTLINNTEITINCQFLSLRGKDRYIQDFQTESMMYKVLFIND